MKDINKIIFLDFDGVINSTAYYTWVHEHPEFLKAGGHRHIDPDSVKKVIELCDKTGASIVISSSWRLMSLEQTLKNLNGIRDLRPILERTVGITPRTDSRERGLEIKYFLNACRKQNFITFTGYVLADRKSCKFDFYPEYLILDDDTDILEEQYDRFIHINNAVGITDRNILEGVKILNKG